MTKERLKAYQTNKRVYNKLCEEIDRLREQLNNVKVVSGQVQASDKEWPYILGHVQVEVSDPKSADAIQRKLIDREKRRDSIRRELDEVERFVAGIEDPAERQIFEWLFLDGMTQEELGDVLHYSQSQISRIVDKKLEDKDA